MGRDWEAAYREGDTPWDKGESAPPLIELLELEGKNLWGNGPVLVPGCGAGHDVRAIAAHGLEVVGYDISASAVHLAESFARSGKERYDAGNFLSDRGNGSYAGLWEHTCFCAILPSQRGDYARAAGEFLKPGALLAGVFYLTPYDAGDEEEGPPFGVTIEEIKNHFFPWFQFEKGWVPKKAYPGREGREWLGLFRRLPIGRGIRETTFVL